MDLWTYSPDEVSILIAGVVPVEGVVDDTFISVSKSSPAISSTRTPDGMISRVHTEDKTYDISLTLMQSSPTNDVLTALWSLDDITRRGKFPLFIKDGTGSTFIFSTSAWIEQIPEVTYGTSALVRTWTIKASNCTINVGGNGDVNPLVSALTGALAGYSTISGILGG